MAPEIIEVRNIDRLYHANGRPVHSMLGIATQFQHQFHGYEGIEDLFGTAKKIREENGVSITGVDVPLFPGERDFFAGTFQPSEMLADPEARQKIERMQADLGTIITGGTTCMNTLGDDTHRAHIIENARALQHIGVETYTIFAGNPADRILDKLGIKTDPVTISRPETQRAIRTEYQRMVRELVQEIREVYGGFILFENCPMQRTFTSAKLNNPVTNWAGTPYLMDALLEATTDMPGVGVMIDWSHLYNQCLYAHLGDHVRANKEMAAFSEKWKDRVYSAHIKDTATRPGVVLANGLMGTGTYMPHDDGIWVARVAGDGMVDFAQALKPLHDYAQDSPGRAVCAALVHEIEDMYRFDLAVAGKGREAIVRAGRHMDQNVLPVVYRAA